MSAVPVIMLHKPPDWEVPVIMLHKPELNQKESTLVSPLVAFQNLSEPYVSSSTSLPCGYGL
jgi:hypothetical protein